MAVIDLMCNYHVLRKMAAANEFRRNENLYRQVALQEAEDKRLRDEEFAQLKREWIAKMEVSFPSHSIPLYIHPNFV